MTDTTERPKRGLSFHCQRTGIIVRTSKLVVPSLAQCALAGAGSRRRVSFHMFAATKLAETEKKDADMKSDFFIKAMTLKAVASKALTFAAVLLLGLAVHAQTTESNTNASAPGTSKVRIVRLSQVKGAVQIDRHIGRGFENAIANLPVVEQSQIRTGVGVAEVEFEDNSSLRIAPNSLVEFPRLEREASGATASTVHLVQGAAYVSIVKRQDKKAPVDEFSLMFGARTLNLDPATHIRLDLVGSQARLSVFDGAVRVSGENGDVIIPKKKMATLQIFDKNEVAVAKDILPNVFDTWDQQEAKYHEARAQFSRFNSPYAYGLNDMMYYGSFVDMAGCGTMWRPYFATTAWDPYANGTWAWYGGAGYSWVSPYPWAWTPYHSGSWMQCGDAGWGWMPGGNWYGVNNLATTTMPTGGGGAISSPRGPIKAPHLPPHPPGPHQPSFIAVSSKPVAASGISVASRSFVFQKDSAGLGVPRGTLGNLQGFSHQTATHGVAQTRVYATIPQPGHVYGVGSSVNPTSALAGSIHRGSPPPPSYSSGAMNPWSQGDRNSGWSGGQNSSSSSVSMGSSAGRSGGAPVSTPVASAPVAVHR